MAHAINHPCHSDFANCKFLHTGITNDPQGVGGTEDEGVVGGDDDDAFYLLLKKQQIAYRHIPVGYPRER